ncbi:MAG: LysR family transcriptional regulator [Tissierellia bacterium]|nr:selenium metabolism-associated LysR family transcriptional regulator [Bacillota bacterium]NLL22520.1 LysR family transcriptional regulator [Tissierellia bacterium]
MDFRQLEAFVITVEQKSFTVAAQKLFLSQPTISSHVRSLEKELGTQLIRRTSREFVVTPEGEQLYMYALGMLRMRDQALRELSDQESSLLLIGVSTIPAQSLLPKILHTSLRKHPALRFTIEQSESLDILEKVRRRNLEVGFVGMKQPDNLCTYVPLLIDEMVIAAPNNEHFQKLKQNKVCLSELMKEPIILRSPFSALEKEAEDFISQLGLSFDDLHIVARMNDAQLVARCVACGLGISFISKSAVADDVVKGDTITFALSDPPLVRTLYMVYRDDEFLSSSAQNLIDTVKEFFALRE